MASQQHRELTPAQLALAQERKSRKEQLAAHPKVVDVVPKSLVANRPWIKIQDVPSIQQENLLRIKVFTWNLLAQCLVRRELFPTSDCLKAGQREGMLHAELLSQKADVLFLQEVDRLEKLEPLLTKAGYRHQYGSGPRKKHGCMIAHSSMFRQIGHRVIHYDDQEVRNAETEQARRGGSFKTKNIALLCALQSASCSDEGVIAATTHLFWHPRYTYERTRQASILRREVNQFRTDVGHPNWPCIIAGDFNFAPDDPTYSLLVGDPLLSAQESLLSPSRVVHTSIDPTASSTTPVASDEGEGESTSDPDRTITNARPATDSDGLLTNLELVSLFQSSPPWRSVYDAGISQIKSQHPSLMTFGDRAGLPPTRSGYYEPEWTSYTHYWKTTLDYIFVQEPLQCRTTIYGILKPLTTQDLDPGLPKKGVSASDHVSLSAEVGWLNTSK